MKQQLKKTIGSIKIGQTNLSVTSKQELLKWATAQTTQSSTSTQLIFTPNPEQIVQAQRDSRFSATLQQADHYVIDGVGLAWALSWLSAEKVERTAGVDVAEQLAKQVIVSGGFVLCLGSLLSEKEVSRMKKHLIGGCDEATLQQVQYEVGYQNIAKPTKKEEKAVLATINKLKPTLVLVAFGAPAQEQWLVDHRDDLTEAGVKIGMVVGGAFDYWSGAVKRAPRWLQRWGLEWLYRLFQQPWRWRRQLRLLVFVWLVVREKVCR